ncbi:MAG TPA: YrdB family protein [Terrabacter sp.]|nr:YrdB family protein [Terrabacter sp.]
MTARPETPRQPDNAPVNANDLVAFAVEVLAVVLLAVWGAHLGQSTVTHVLGGVLVPGAAIVLWGLFAAPRARVRVPVLVVATKVLVLGAAVVAAWSLLPPVWAALVTVVVVVNTLLMWVGPFAHPLGRE